MISRFTDTPANPICSKLKFSKAEWDDFSACHSHKREILNRAPNLPTENKDRSLWGGQSSHLEARAPSLAQLWALSKSPPTNFRFPSEKSTYYYLEWVRTNKTHSKCSINISYHNIINSSVMITGLSCRLTEITGAAMLWALRKCLLSLNLNHRLQHLKKGTKASFLFKRQGRGSSGERTNI